MKKQLSVLLATGIFNLLFFTGIFSLFQNERIYHHTLGRISENYERTGDWNNYEIKKVAKPYLTISKENFYNWDGSIYKCISETMYEPENACFSKVKAAFFPLLPVLWKITGASALGISVINYLLFVLSIALLIIFLSKASPFHKTILFSILISLPTVISYYIPYSEALFLFTMTIAVTGLLKKKYLLFFAGCFLMAMVRPATVFILLSLLSVEFVILLKTRNFSSFFKEISLKSLPFLTGYLLALYIQYSYTGSWSSLLEAREYWGQNVSFAKDFSDWSVEGFALSAFGLFFICLPAIGFLVFLLMGSHRPEAGSYLEKLKEQNSEYLLLLSVFYLSGILAFTFITQGWDLHSFSRYIFASPPFYIALLLLLNNLYERQSNYFFAAYAAASLLLIIFLSSVEYGGERTQFPFFGMYMLMATFLFLPVYKYLPKPVLIVSAGVLILFNTIWNTYLLNVFFSNGWIFT